MADEAGRFVQDQQIGIFVNNVQDGFHLSLVEPQINSDGRRCAGLSSRGGEVSWASVKEKWKKWLPVAFMLVFALTRWPGLLPENFSAVYALAFCAGVYFAGRMAWWLPLGTLLASDIALNMYYWLAKGWDVWSLPLLKYQGFCYVAYILIILLGRRFKPQSSFLSLLGGGILGALLFYFITNTVSWFFNPFQNPEYTKDLTGWIIALTKGTGGWPTTMEFFRNTLMSGGLFTGLFVGAMKLTEAPEPEEAREAGEESGETEPVPEEAKA
jgi:hypothetical protein